MDLLTVIRHQQSGASRWLASSLAWPLVTALVLCGCEPVQTGRPSVTPAQRKTLHLATITGLQADSLLSDLGFHTICSRSEPNTVVVIGSSGEIRRAEMVVDLVDCNAPYTIETLAPASMARMLPSNDEIAEALGDIAIGTFAIAPVAKTGSGAIVDIHGNRVVAILPVRFRRHLLTLMELGPEGLRQVRGATQRSAATDTMATAAAESAQSRDLDPVQPGPKPSFSEKIRQSSEPSAPQPSGEPVKVDTPPRPDRNVPAERHAEWAEKETHTLPSRPSTDRDHSRLQSPVATRPEPAIGLARGILKPSRPAAGSASHPSASVEAPLANGDDILELSLPEKIELVQLLDLAGEYLHLDCVYDAEKIGKQMVTLKLHSKVRSELRVQDLYSLLKTILKFKGLVMTRHEGNLVTIVPITEALEVDPELVDPNTATLDAGDVVVTRIFELQHIDVASVTNLLQNMKLSVAVSPVEGTQTLFVTCYAHRMERIERLVRMVDRPGRPKEFRFRQLQYTAVGTLAPQVVALAEELEDIPITIATVEQGKRGATKRSSSDSSKAQREMVYLDTDERTNRLLMIGYEEQLETVEGLIDALDVSDHRSMAVYDLQHITTEELISKLTQLGIIGPSARSAAKTTTATSYESPRVVPLEATNSLLVEATDEQHAQIQMAITYVDVSPQDLRTLRVYGIAHVDAEDVISKLQELHIIGHADRPTPSRAKSRPSAGSSSTPIVAMGVFSGTLVEVPQVVLLQTTNSLLVNATHEQHERIQQVIDHIDVEARREIVPYEIYFLENQDPEKLAQVLDKLIQETITDADGKVEQVIRKTDEMVTIIPDPGTFSLIVHASRKNQDWIANLIERLDKRRPQVLIDVTLVEITKQDAFTYDLNVVQSFPDLTATSGLTGQVAEGVSSADVLGRLTGSGQDRFVDYQSVGGDFRGFYGDEHINILLEAMQSKNYGRVLAKPKILVNDNEPGTIKTADTTYVVKRSSVPVSTGGAGTDATLIETAVDYEPYEAGITLDITPHISPGDLLRLGIELIRSDFRETEDTEKPPDTTASELKTTVFVPDGSTIILGGLLKLNQNKGGAKVPILGDIPIVGGLFRSVNNKDSQSKLYVFVKAEIIRPAEADTQGMADLEAISERNRLAFEKHEQEFQEYQDWPGVKPKPVEPRKVLEAQ